MSDAPAAQLACLNCNTQFIGQYCSSCGQKHGPAMPTTMEIAGDLLRSALSPSGKVFETLWTLLRRPGELTRAFISGQRMRYVHPVRVYLLCVFVLVAAITVNNTIRGWTARPPFEVESSALFARPDAKQQDAKAVDGNDAGKPPSAAREAGRALGSHLPEWVRERLKARAKNLDAAESAKLQQKATTAVTKQYSALFAVLVPFMALVNWMLYAGRGLTYAAHFVFLLHATAASCLILLPVYVLDLPIVYVPATLAAMAWCVLAARRAFAVSLWGSLWRYVVYMIPTLLFSALAGAVVSLVSVLFVD
mgnify:CR=1 FL=1